MSESVAYIDHMKPWQRSVKRLFDIFFAAIALLLVSPFALLILLTIKWESEGPALFCQERVGYKGKIFSMYKFRSMYQHAEDGTQPLLCQENDIRLTPFGKFIRDHHLDEIPQLWNILKGDMSFVGPRPERKHFVDIIMQHNPNYVYLYQLRPGVFSYATLYNGYTDTIEKMLERLRLDLDYLTTRTLYVDMEIIVKTLYYILSGKRF
ncbi:bacterial sugar transferase [gut metagenome]|uniref:Bacterial sugar transferase n=1 Tax=gut metagenome TaxID=749906 RepID=J9GLY7_9ZZZZ